MTTLVARSIRDRALDALRTSGIPVFPFPCRVGEDCVRGTLDGELAIAQLRSQPEYWQEIPSGLRSLFHADIGEDRVEFRSYTSVAGSRPVSPVGSCQVVISPRANLFYADIDHTNPTQDVVGLFHHGYDVVRNEGPGLWKRIVGFFRGKA